MSSYGVSLSSAPVPKPRFAGGRTEMAAAPKPAALMKSRRFQKSDSPVISELGMSGGGRIRIGTPGQEQRERGRNGVSGNCPVFYLKLMRISPTGFPLTFLVSRLRFYFPVSFLLSRLRFFSPSVWAADREGFEPSIRF